MLINPIKEVFVCIYCRNADLCLIGLKNILKLKHSEIPDLREKVLSLNMCSPATDQCKLDECKNYSGASGVTINSIDLSHINSMEEVTFALWNKAELEERTTTLSVFVEELADWISKANVHIHVQIFK